MTLFQVLSTKSCLLLYSVKFWQGKTLVSLAHHYINTSTVLGNGKAMAMHVTIIFISWYWETAEFV